MNRWLRTGSVVLMLSMVALIAIEQQKISLLTDQSTWLSSENGLLRASKRILAQRLAKREKQCERLVAELAKTKQSIARERLMLEQAQEIQMAHASALWNLLRAEQLANHLIEDHEGGKDPMAYFKAAAFETAHARKLEGHHEPLTVPLISPALFFLAKSQGYSFRLHDLADDIFVVTPPKK